jgi:nitrogen fixation protein NifM
MRHILITINDALAGSERHVALEKITAIRQRLQKEPQRFAEQALKHSECPTAMNGGLLGNVPRGQLYPQLESAAFALAEGGLSEVLESELGYHLIWCEAIQPERQSAIEEARKNIRDHLEQQRRSMCQKSWINGLRQAAVAELA